jgi:hypothetical protein
MLRALALSALMLTSPALTSAQSLKGVWLGVSQVTINGVDDVQVVEFTQPRYLIYTDAFFSWSFVGEGERPTGDLTDEQFLQVASEYNTAAGTYIRDGTSIRYNIRAAINPNLSAAANQPLIREIRVLTATRLVTQVTNADGVTTLLVYDRAE